MSKQEEDIPGIYPAPGQIQRVELVHSGEDYFYRLKNIITDARSEIHLQFYIFDNDFTGNEIIEELKKAASRKVNIFILLDGYGASVFSKEIRKDLIQRGMNIRFFSPFFLKNIFYVGRRLHHKVVVADGSIALIGGINIADKYRGDSKKAAWLDYAVQIENREIAKSLEDFCRNIFTKKKRTGHKGIKSVVKLGSGTSLRILQNDWLKKKNEVTLAYLNAIRNAKEEVVIVGSYFFPGKTFRNVLNRASARGVKIKLILAGVSDVFLVRSATEYMYSSLLKHNIELYEWNKSVLHGKAAVADKKWTTIGSFNLNHLSSYASIEMNVEIDSETFSRKFASHLEEIMSQCTRVTNETLHIKKGVFSNIFNWFAYWVGRIILTIIVYVPYKRLRNLS